MAPAGDPTVDRSELSSLHTQISELGARVTRAGEGLDGPDTADVAAALYEAERAMRTAGRAVGRARDLLS